jgi:hypothetical protein
MTGYWLDAHDQTSNAKLGTGPILSVSRFASTRRLSKSGTWGADLAATESRIQHTNANPALRVLDSKRVVRCHVTPQSATASLVGPIELGAGVVDTLGIEAAGYGMDIGGNDLSVLLANPIVHELEVGTEAAPLGIKAAVDLVAALGAGTGITVDTTTYLSLGDTSIGDDQIVNVTNITNFTTGDPIVGAGIQPGTYVTTTFGTTVVMSQPATATGTSVTLHTNQVAHTFSGESVLAALILLANATGEDWRLEGTTVYWLYRTRASSGMYAVAGGDPVALLTNDPLVLITSLSYQRDSSQVFNRIFPYGAGSGDAREGIAGITAPLPPGFSYHETVIGAKHYFGIQHSDSVAENGPIERTVTYRSVVSPTEIARLGLLELRRNLTPLDTYTLSVEKLRSELPPGYTIHVEYHDSIDGYRPLDIDADLLIQQVEQEVTVDGALVVGLQLSNQRRWPQTVAARLEKLATDIDSLSNYSQPSV